MKSHLSGKYCFDYIWGKRVVRIRTTQALRGVKLDLLLDQGDPVGSEEVPGQLVATGVLGNRHKHVREVLSLHHVTIKALLHHPADGKQEEKVEAGANYISASVFMIC